MTEASLEPSPRLARFFMTEEAIYGLILVSGMLVITGAARATAATAIGTVAVTVVVFYAAHVYAGGLARLAERSGAWTIRTGIAAAARQSSGMLLASALPLGVLILGAMRVFEDATAIWIALIVNTISLGVLGWMAVARMYENVLARLGGALITAAFGGALILLKSAVTH